MDTVIPILIGLVALACACFSKAIANQRTRAHFSQTELESTEAAMSAGKITVGTLAWRTFSAAAESAHLGQSSALASLPLWAVAVA